MRVTTTDYEAVPAVERDDVSSRPGTVVMKFGGSSVADPEKLKSVARRLVAARESGSRVVAVLSAMGSTTDELLDLGVVVGVDIADVTVINILCVVVLNLHYLIAGGEGPPEAFDLTLARGV